MKEKIILNDINEITDDFKKFLPSLENKSILITGGRGFLGTYFLKTFVEINNRLVNPMKIYVIDNLITSKDNLTKYPNVEFIESDISEKIEINGPINYIIHSASIASPLIYRKFPLKTIDVNYQGTRNLLDLAKEKNVDGMLFLSSSEIYGDPKIIPTPETYWGNVSCNGPRACYDESKRLAETVCLAYYQQYETPIKIARPFNAYGPYLNLDDGRVIPDFFKNAMKQSKIIIHSDGTPSRSFCYVSDSIRGFLKILFFGKSGSIYNVGNDEEISMKELAIEIKNLVGNTEIIYKKNQDKHYTTDNPQKRVPDLTKIKKELEFFPKISLDEGLKRVYAWYKESLQ
jgi:dTDP-glucose 4,6-dehydratase/UDP-glucuronate decarboxylase